MASIETMIKWMKVREGKVSYSMTNRLGPNSYDCSSSVYFALREGGFLPDGLMGNTDSLFGHLESNNWKQVPLINGNYAVKRGDVFIWGNRGGSGGAAGHTGIFVDSADNIIHCNYGYNGITTNNHDVIWGYNGRPAITIYRFNGKTADTPPKPSQPIITQGGSLKKKGLEYRAHISKQGDLGFVQQAQIAGTTGKNIPIEGIDLFYNGSSGYFEIESHISSIGWAKTTQIGSKGKAKTLEAFKVKLKGSVAKRYTIQYQSHIKNLGWESWKNEGEVSGTTGKKLPIEAVKFRLVQKKITQGTAKPNVTGIAYRTHISNQGWLGYLSKGVSGTVGKTIPVEAVEVLFNGSNKDIQLQGHVSNIGWQPAAKIAGTTGKAVSLEAFKLKLLGESAKKYDINYRAHSAEIGWQPWVKNGAVAGTTGKVLPIEAIEITITNK